MIISGLQKTTLLDFPGHVAATIFLGGCNFRCPFCHNMDIVEKPTKAYTEDDVYSFLIKRKSVLDGVCITGGEPTMYADLKGFIENIKDIKRPDGSSLLIKLDTNGTNTKLLNELIELKLIDYVAIDIKSSIEKYNVAAGLDHYPDGGKEMVEQVKKSVNVLVSSDIEYEFRTTIIKEYHDEEEMTKIGELICGAKKYFLQSFTDSEYVPNHLLNPVTKEQLKKYEELMKAYVNNVSLRGVD